MKTSLTGTRRPAARVAATIVCMVTLSSFAAACGSEPKQSTGVASIGTDEPADNESDTDSTEPADDATTDDTSTDGSTDDTTDDTDSSTPDSIDPEDAFNEYTECMRDNGIDLPDAQVVSADGSGRASNGGGPIIVTNTMPEGDGPEGGLPFDPESEEYQEADEECMPILEAVRSEIEIDPEVEAEHREQMLDFAECMRDHGIDFPDPVFSENGGGGVSVQIGEEGEEGNGPAFDDEDFQAANEECGEIFGDEGGPIAVGQAADADS
jgi:hypothetical protein